MQHPLSLSHTPPDAATCDIKEQEQLKALRAELDKKESVAKSTSSKPAERDFEGGFGGQEDLEDRYATTSGEH